MSDTPEAPRPSGSHRIVGDYEILEEIGSGGMSRVYRARSLRDDSIVAMKAIHLENVASDFQERLEREPEIQRGLGHDNIVHLIDSFRVGDELFLAMEHIDGRSLARIIYDESGPLPIERARIYFRQVLRAVEHLHRLGIIHRDVKPSNILVSWRDDVKLADFGIAKFTWQQAGTSTQRGLGTPEYMSPEQARGGQIDLRSDIYSVGISLFEALTGRRPFMREQQTPAAYMEVIDEILNRPLPDPRIYNPSLGDDIVRLLRKATAKNPDERFQSAAEFLGALEVVGGEPSRAAAPPVTDSTPTMVGGAPLSPPRAYASEPSAPSGDRTVVGPPRSAPPPRVEPVEPERRGSVLPWVLLVLLILAVGGYFAWPTLQDYMARRNEPPPGATLSEQDAAQISQRVAGEVQRYTLAGNVPALAFLYADKGVRFFKLKSASRSAIEKDLRAFESRIESTTQFDIEVRKADAPDDSTITSQWLITYERLRDDGGILRGQTLNNVTLELMDGEWKITRQTEIWTDRRNVDPPKSEPVDTATTEPEVVDVPAPEQPAQPLTPQSRRAAAEAFVNRVTAGNAQAAVSQYVSPSMSSGARERLLTLLRSGTWSSEGLTTEGENVAATMSVTDPAGGTSRYRFTFEFVDENGAKIRAITFSQQ